MEEKRGVSWYKNKGFGGPTHLARQVSEGLGRALRFKLGSSGSSRAGLTVSKPRREIDKAWLPPHGPKRDSGRSSAYLELSDVTEVARGGE